MRLESKGCLRTWLMEGLDFWSRWRQALSSEVRAGEKVAGKEGIGSLRIHPASLCKFGALNGGRRQHSSKRRTPRDQISDSKL